MVGLILDKNSAAPKSVDKDKSCFCELCGICVCENAYRDLVVGLSRQTGP